jgi:cell division protein FtsI/penicillin-binding protein 2
MRIFERNAVKFPNEVYQKKVRKRTRILAFLLTVWIIGILIRLIDLQVFLHAGFKAQVAKQNQDRTKILPERGTIYDRNGKILARSIPVPSLFYSPPPEESFEQQMKTIRRLEATLDLSAKDLERIKSRLQKKSLFSWIKRKVDATTAERVKAMGLNGVFSREEPKRFYPQAKLAAHVLGGVDIDDKGQSGIELAYDEVLRGKEGEVLIFRDVKRREYYSEVLEEPQSGKDITLTIDENIQYIAQRGLEKAVLENRADWAAAIISRPDSGEILAMASYPAFDPNAYPPSSEEELNRATRFNFEPGSTFKIVTASAALENRAVSLNEIFDCREGTITVPGSPIRDHKKFGLLTLPGVVAHSSNVGMIQVGLRIDPDSFYKTIRDFGFGSKTGLDLPAEEAGLLMPPKKWSRRSLPALSIGYEISATAIQILQAVNIIANRGLRVAPRIVSAVEGSSAIGQKASSPPDRVISEKTADALIKILEQAVLEGTGQAAWINGYTVAGKTGTTQKIDPELKRYSSSKHIASFVGFVPVEKPAISMIVVLDEPQKADYYGGQVAAPVFREISGQVLRYLRVNPQKSLMKAALAAGPGREGER